MNNKYQSWKKPYLIILTIVTIFCVIGGLCYHVIRWVDFWDGFRDGFTTDARHSSDGKAYNFGTDVTDIDIDIDMGDIEFTNGDELIVECDCSEEYLPDITFENGKLTVVQEDHVNFGLEDDSKIDFYITIPSGVTLNSLVINTEMGDVDIDEVNCSSFDLTSSLGDLDLGKITTESFTVESSMGDVDVTSGNLGKVDISCSMGDIEISDAVITGGSVECSMGDISLEGDISGVDYSCGMGQITVNGDDI